jgi:hypothetical protein
MKILSCGRYVTCGFIASIAAWVIFLATLVYAAVMVPDLRVLPGQLFTQRGGVQAAGFIAGWWISIAGLAACVIGYLRDYKGPRCLPAVVPAALYVANPWSAMVFVNFIGG